MSEPYQSAEVVRPPLQLVRLPVDKPQPAVTFLRERSGGVMDLIAHFWERLAHTPPLQRRDLHLVVATPVESEHININIPQLDSARFSGAMLYVPKAHRADVLAFDPPTAAAFASYISQQGARAFAEPAKAVETGESAASEPRDAATLPLTDLSSPQRSGTPDATEMPAEPPSAKQAGGNNGRVAIDFLTGEAEGIRWMAPLLLPLVHKRAPARQLVNVVMQLPAEAPCEPDPRVRLAKESDVPVLNRWRRQYKEERGILFDADMDAWVQNQRVFVYELPAGAASGDASADTVVAVAKIDLDLQNLVEIGGLYTFPEYRKRGFGAAIVRDMACRIRQMGKLPTLQVDEQNLPALNLYEAAGWRPMGRLARVWLTDSR